MARSFSEYPTLLKAFRFMAADSCLELRDGWVEVCPPLKFDTPLRMAEAVAAQLDGTQVCSHIDPDSVEDMVEGDDDCLEIVATGEQTVAQMILAKIVGGSVLEEIMVSAYDGELYGLLFVSYR